MKNLKLYYIDDEYIDYLRKYDNKVPYNKNKTRPYVGILYEYKGVNYFAPLASPKPKHLKINDKSMDVFKIDDGKLGILNLNNMLPTPLECLSEVLPIIDDITYKTLLEKQLTYLNDNKNKLYKKVAIFKKQYMNNRIADFVLKRCCDFKLLEEKCNEYNKHK